MTSPAEKRKHRWLWWTASGIAALFLVLFLPVSPSGCYLEIGDYFNSTSGHTFSYLADGNTFSCNEYANRAREVGSYSYEQGVGWVMRLRGSQRRALMKPRLLFIRFSDIDGGDRPVTAPFQWRDPLVWKTSAVLRRLRPDASTNAAAVAPERNSRSPNRVAGRIDIPPPTPPGMRVRIRAVTSGPTSGTALALKS